MINHQSSQKFDLLKDGGVIPSQSQLKGHKNNIPGGLLSFNTDKFQYFADMRHQVILL